MAFPTPGYSISELLKDARALVTEAKQFTNAFSGKWDNAAFKLQELDGHYKQAEYYFRTLEQNISDQGLEHPNHQVLRRTLQECKEYLAKYESILEVEIEEPQGRLQTLQSHTRSFTTTKTTAKWAWSKNKAVELKQKIMNCVGEINHFNNSVSK